MEWGWVRGCALCRVESGVGEKEEEEGGSSWEWYPGIGDVTSMGGRMT